MVMVIAMMTAKVRRRRVFMTAKNLPKKSSSKAPTFFQTQVYRYLNKQHYKLFTDLRRVYTTLIDLKTVTSTHSKDTTNPEALMPT